MLDLSEDKAGPLADAFLEMVGAPLDAANSADVEPAHSADLDDADLRWALVKYVLLSALHDGDYDARTRVVLRKVGAHCCPCGGPTAAATNRSANPQPSCGSHSWWHRYGSRGTRASSTRTIWQPSSAPWQWPPSRCVPASGDGAGLARALALTAGHATRGTSRCVTQEQQEREAREKGSAMRRALLIGAATVVGGVVLGITGGIAAPLVGSALAGLGASFFGTAAGVGVITSIFGAAGAGLTGTPAALAVSGGGRVCANGRRRYRPGPGDEPGYKMAKRTKGVEDFEFTLMRGGDRMNVTVAISGWLQTEQDLYGVARRPALGCPTHAYGGGDCPDRGQARKTQHPAVARIERRGRSLLPAMGNGAAARAREDPS